MYFRTETHEYRNRNKSYSRYNRGRIIKRDSKLLKGQRGWQERELGTENWKDIPENLWGKIYALRKLILQNSRPTLAETVRVRIGKKYDEQTKKTNKFAYKYGVDLDNLITR